jgi:hypothetical protein
MVYLQNKISISVNYEGLWMEISVYLELIILWQFWYILWQFVFWRQFSRFSVLVSWSKKNLATLIQMCDHTAAQ